MKRIILFTLLLVMAVFVMPTYAGKPVKAPPGIKVSDSQGNLLGMLIRHEEDATSIGHYRIQIFVSSMGKFIEASQYKLEHLTSTLAYETYNCTDDAYIGQSVNYRPDHLYYDSDLAKTYIVMGPQTRIVAHSYRSLDSGECQEVPDPGDGYDGYLLFEIPPEDVLIPLPLQFPLSYGY